MPIGTLTNEDELRRWINLEIEGLPQNKILGLSSRFVSIEINLDKIEKEGVPPSGVAGGVLAGLYPNPSFAVDMATQAELDAEKAERQGPDSTEKASREEADAAEKVAREAADATEKGLREAADKAEKEGREAADAAEATARMEADEEEVVNREAADLSEKSERVAADSAEKAAREAADSAEKAEREAMEEAFVKGPEPEGEVADGGLVVWDGESGRLIKETALITSAQIEDIEAAKIAGKLSGEQIAAETIQAVNIAAGAITAGKLSVLQLSAISADLGAVTAGTVTGATFRTSASNPKVILDSAGLRATDSGGVNLVNIPSNGETATFTGFLSAVGVELPEATEVIPDEENRLVWKNGSVEASEVYAYTATGGSAIIMHSNRSKERPHGYAVVRATNKEGMESILEVYAPTGAQASLTARVGGVEKDILKSSGISDFPQLPETAKRVLTMKEDVTLMGTSNVSQFLQLTETAKRKINFGTSSVTFTASNVSATKKIAHGLGSEVKYVFITGKGATGGVWYQWAAVGTTEFSVIGAYNAAGSFTAEFSWMAIS